MRLLKLDPDDGELFQFKLDAEQIKFFHAHNSDFQKMWEEQGKTFWLRFLVTCQLHFEAHVLADPEFGVLLFQGCETRVLDFVFICMHKHFIEAPKYSSAKIFIDNLLSVAEHNFTKPQNESYSKKVAEVLSPVLKCASIRKEISSAMVTLLSLLYFSFMNGCLTLLKRWLKESDLDDKSNKSIDYTLYYWKPFGKWSEKDWYPSCFEKYLSSYWKENLPKMLLTCDLHNNFNVHKDDGCCSFDMGETDSDEVSSVDKSFSLNVVQTFKPDVAYCKEHAHCLIRIQHSERCMEPYICFGKPPCKKTCETLCKDNLKTNLKDFWKKSVVEVFKCKDKNKRSVSTFVKSSVTQIVTFCPNTETFTAHDLVDFFLTSQDSSFKNAYSQHKRKEDYRRKLRKKLQDRNCDFRDPLQLDQQYECAQGLWFKQFCSVKLSTLNGPSYENILGKPLFKFKNALSTLTTVAIGTCGMIFGRVVLPSRKLPATNKSKTSIKANTQRVEAKPGVEKSKKKGNKKAAPVVSTPGTSAPADSSGKALSNEIISGNHATEHRASSDVCAAKEDGKPKISIAESTHATEHRASSDVCAAKEDGKPKISIAESAHATEHCASSDVCAAKGDGKPKLSIAGKQSPNHELSPNIEDLSKKSTKANSNAADDSDEDLATYYNFVKTNAEGGDNELTGCSPKLKDCAVPEKSDKPGDSVQKKSKLRVCAFCHVKEIQCKTFKRCSRCRAENLPEQYYYCSRDCQVADWEKSHREIHSRRNVD